MEWNNKVKNRLQHFEVAPPEECWRSIQSELQKGKIIPLSSPYAKGISWLKYTAAAVVTGLIIFTFINQSFRNNLQNAVMGSGTKAAIVDTTPANKIDSIATNDSTR
ncbi:MAG: hypothetical protein ACO28V_05675 [Chitinophagaceae bacterium]